MLTMPACPPRELACYSRMIYRSCQVRACRILIRWWVGQPPRASHDGSAAYKRRSLGGFRSRREHNSPRVTPTRARCGSCVSVWSSEVGARACGGVGDRFLNEPAARGAPLGPVAWKGMQNARPRHRSRRHWELRCARTGRRRCRRRRAGWLACCVSYTWGTDTAPTTSRSHSIAASAVVTTTVEPPASGRHLPVGADAHARIAMDIGWRLTEPTRLWRSREPSVVLQADAHASQTVPLGVLRTARTPARWAWSTTRGIPSARRC